MATIFLLISVFAGTAKSTVSKLLSPYSATRQGFGLVNTLLAMTACLVIAVVGAVTPRNSTCISLFSVGIGLLFGLCNTLSQLVYMRAMACGSISVVTFVYSCGFLLPTFAGTLFWSEPLSGVLLFGVGILLCAFVLCARAKSLSTGGVTSNRTEGMAAAVIAMGCSGIMGILQKIHQSSAHKTETTGFLLSAFFVSALLSFVLSGVGNASQRKVEVVSLPPRAVLYAALGGVCIGAANIVNLRLTGLLPAALCFPVTNGGIVVLSALVGRLLFRETLSKIGYIGIVLGVVAICLIGLGK